MKNKSILALVPVLILAACIHRPGHHAMPITIGVSKPSYGSQELIAVSFTGATGKASDWIGLYLSGAPSTNYVQWLYSDGTQNKGTSGITNGSVVFPSGLDNGNYEARLFFTNSFVMQASVLFKIVPTPPSVTMGRTTYYTNEQIKVSFSGASASRYDWIGLFPQGSTNRIDWLYTDGTRNGTAGGTAGAVTFTNSVKTPGYYDARLFFDGGNAPYAGAQFRVVPTTPAIAVDQDDYAPKEPIVVRFTGASGRQYDWIGLFASGASDTNYLDWLFTDGTQTGKTGIVFGAVTFSKGLPNVGKYEARLFFDNGYTAQASAPFQVPQGALTLIWNYPLTQQSTNNVFRVYHSTNDAAPVNTWNVLATVPCTNNNQATLTATVRVNPGPHFFSITTSNLWGESAFSDIVAAPPLASGDVNLKIKPVSKKP